MPAAALAGRLLTEAGERRKAAKIIEAAWKAHPHPDLADAYAHLRLSDSARDRLSRVQAPTLILWGDGDRWIPIRDGTRFARELPRSEFVVLQRTGHDAAEESPDQVNRLLLDYLKEGLSRIPENLAWSPPSSRSWRSSNW